MFSVYTQAVIVHVVWGEAWCQKVKVKAAAATETPTVTVGRKVRLREAEEQFSRTVRAQTEGHCGCQTRAPRTVRIRMGHKATARVNNSISENKDGYCTDLLYITHQSVRQDEQ